MLNIIIELLNYIILPGRKYPIKLHNIKKLIKLCYYITYRYKVFVKQYEKYIKIVFG